MDFARKVVLATSLVGLLMVAVRMKARVSEDAGRKEIEAFNRRYVELHLKMDTAGVLALWEEEGVDLLPGDDAMIGKKKIVAWVEDIVSKMPGYKVTKQEMEFHDIHACGEWASEWATEHQVVQPPDGKPPIEGYGKMALVLHRAANGEWKVQQEMWNAAPKP
jgi:ketosteroid isomerase-like protein